MTDFPSASKRGEQITRTGRSPPDVQPRLARGAFAGSSRLPGGHVFARRKRAGQRRGAGETLNASKQLSRMAGQLQVMLGKYKF